MMVFQLRTYLFWLTLFSVAMGFMESAVVVYLRTIYYPQGFAFPLAPMNFRLAVTEFLREAATLIMLMAAGYLAGRNFRERLAWFVYCFAIWDIFYYVFLRMLIGWPGSLFTWDILFLIPVIWTGPVIAPILASLTMILMAGIILFFERKGNTVRISRLTGTLVLTGAFIVFLSFIWDYSVYALKGSTFQHYVPHTFNWALFVTGELVILSGLYRLVTDYRRCFSSS